MLEKSIKNITKSYSNFVPTFVDHNLLLDMNFNGHCLIKNNISISKKVINLHTPYTLAPQFRTLNTAFTLGNCLFGFVKLTENADLDKHKYSDYSTEFNSRSEFLFINGSYGKNVIFLADISLVMLADSKGEDILIFGKGPTQGLDDTTLTAKAKYPIDLRQSGRRFVLSLHYDGSNSFLFVNASKVYQLKAKKSEIKRLWTVFRSCFKRFYNYKYEKNAIKGVVKLFSVDFNPIDTNNFFDIHKYLMKRTCYKIIFGLIKKIFVGLLTSLTAV